ncbi:MAG: carbon starvation protein A [Pirellulaceae bacterium]|nr:carbon starvation protein A [Pirellulaceae bacterium]
MSTLIVVLITVVALVSAYRIYGSYLAEKIFQLNDGRLVPSRELEDRIDFVPTRKSVVFGHHFTSIAGTGPIVGPALAVFWGWLPALLWVILGGIFVGAVHDFGSLVVSLRNRGETIGQVAGRLISKRTRLLFLLILFFALTVVLGIFGLVVAQVFQLYPSSVLGTWISLPLAVLFGWLARKGKTASWFLLMATMLVIYGSVWLGAYYLQIRLEPEIWWAAIGGETVPSWVNSVVLWTIILLVYCYFASVMPVSLLLQPRDYLNSWQLIIALSVLVVAICYAGIINQADLVASAPAMVAANEMPAGAPPMFPFLFITIACGAVSGFHCLVSSGTTSKQVAKESDSQAIGFGSMLLESGLAVTVILACCAGIGMGLFQRTEKTDAAGKTRYQFVARDNIDSADRPLTVEEIKGPSEFAAWRERYDSSRSWNDYRMAETVGAFVDGGASFLTVFRLPLVLGQAVLAVLVACFAATTLDSATRLQRYVIQELGTNLKLKPLENKHVATGVAVGLAAMIALMPSSSGGPGTGGTVLWPLFGATNQLLAGMAFLVILFYLWRRGIPVHFLVLPLVLMAVMPLWALGYQLFGPSGFLVAGKNQNWILGSIGVATMALQLWMFAEALWLLPKVRGLREAMSESKSVVK